MQSPRPSLRLFYVLYNFYQVLTRDAPGISEKDENRSKSTKVTKVTVTDCQIIVIV